MNPLLQSELNRHSSLHHVYFENLLLRNLLVYLVVYCLFENPHQWFTAEGLFLEFDKILTKRGSGTLYVTKIYRRLFWNGGRPHLDSTLERLKDPSRHTNECTFTRFHSSRL